MTAFDCGIIQKLSLDKKIQLPSIIVATTLYVLSTSYNFCAHKLAYTSNI